MGLQMDHLQSCLDVLSAVLVSSGTEWLAPEVAQAVLLEL